MSNIKPRNRRWIVPPIQLADTREKHLPTRIERSIMHLKYSKVDNFNDSYPSYGKSGLKIIALGCSCGKSWCRHKYFA